MTQQELIEKLQLLKPVLKKEGITLLGIFGSYARNEQTAQSDVDILYDIDDPKAFAKRFGGFGAFTRLEELKSYIAQQLNTEVDFVAKKGLNSVSKKYVEKDLLYV